MATREQQLDLIRTLLAIADGGSPYPEERDRAREQAERMMVRLAIDEAGVRMTAEEAARPTTRVFEFDGTYLKDQIQLVCQIAHVFSCRSVIHAGRRVTAVGFASDLTIVAALVDSLLPTMRVEMSVYGGSQSRRKAFAWSFTAAVVERLRDFYAGALRDAEAAGTGSELVILDRVAQVELAYHEMFPRLRSLRRRTLTTWEGWDEGAAAGQRADISLGRKVDVAPGPASRPARRRALGT